MNKHDLVAEMAKKTGMTKKSAEEALNALTSTVQSSMKKKEKVTLVGFGTWEVRQRKARTGMNPRTGKPLKIPAKKVPVFKPGKTLKSVVK